ncbi:acetolactate synthase-1/2/3 large subunit [Sphingobium xenophagum]|uniref:Acetolactate synthase-1/2/3 large subunit n=1 Tax=Sphingobium xenophagum TaxID=121428 RepID=A0ABU1X6M0_SPHXE|nr:thiamine pyrophosphate-binding protein [Sphingobium xenophagum]MDR7157233.1 acetolactate synthase-1/2/3 large subunit [Sphingobium xenophagum]
MADSDLQVHGDTDGASQKLAGADAVAKSLAACGVEVVFGYTGGSVNALARALVDENFKMIAGRTEIGAAWMSYGYNRIKRRASSAVLTWHVGSLHASPVIYGATMDGTPLLFMTMDNPPAMEARDGLQDALKVYPALSNLAKYSKKVTDGSDLPVIVRQAVKAASTGKFGSSVLVLSQPAMFQETSIKVEPLTLPKPPVGNADDVRNVWDMLKSAERPVLYVGAGVHLSDAADEVRELAQLLGVPVVSTSWGGRGVLDDRDELYIGASGSFGWISGNDALQRSDLWIALGVSFSQMSTGSWTISKPEKVVHVDIDTYELGKIFEPTVAIEADAKGFLRQLLSLAQGDEVSARQSSLEAWREETRSMKASFLEEMLAWAEPDAVPLNQYHVIRVMSDLLPDDTLVVGDSGGQAFALYRSFRFKANTPRPTGGHYMSLGAGLPVAIGAKMADPSRTVVVYHGDGGFYYDISDLSLLAEHNIKVIVIIDNNGCLLANRSASKAAGFDNPWVDLPQSTDFIAVAKGFGVDGETVEKPEDLEGAIKRAIASDKSYVLDVRTTSGMRIRRALTNIIPIVGDRTPKFGHLDMVLDGSWPS